MAPTRRSDRIASSTREGRPDAGFGTTSVTAVLATTCSALPPFLIGSLAVQVRSELRLAISQVGTLIAMFFVTSALASPLAGRTIERLGGSRGMRLSCIASAVCLVGIALAASWGAIAAFLVVGGLSYALVHVSANLFIARRAPVHRQGLAYGIKQSGIPAATLLGGLAVPAFALTVGWRWAFVSGAALSLAIAALVPPRRASRSDSQRGLRPESSMLVLVVLTLGGALGSSAANALGAFLVDSSVSAGLDERSAGVLLAAASLFGICTRIGIGWLADRASRRRLLWVAGMLLLGAFAYAGLASQRQALLVPAALAGFGGGWGWPGLFNFVVVLHNRKAPAAATGITQSGAYIGGFVGPIVFGFTAERVSYSAAWLLAACLALLGAAAMVTGRHILQREREHK
jgi:MFS family permease